MVHLNPFFDEAPNPNRNKVIQIHGKISIILVFCNSEDRFSLDQFGYEGWR